MTAQPPLPMVPVAGAIPVGSSAALIEDGDGGRVFVLGQLFYAWAVEDVALRRLAAVKLVEHEVAAVSQVCAAFGVGTVTLWRWRAVLAEQGVAGLVPGKRGPKGPSRLTPEVVADITARRGDGGTLAQIGDALSMAPNTVRRALLPPGPEGAGAAPSENDVPAGAAGPNAGPDDTTDADAQLPLLGAPAPRGSERALARTGLLTHADPVFTPAARVPLAGLFLALPALEATGLLGCAKDVYGALPGGFYGLDTMLTEGVFRALVGEARAQGATRIDPIVLGRVLGLDRAPEVKTIRRKIAQLAEQSKAADLLAGMAKHHLATTAGSGGTDGDGAPGVVLYVDGHVRAYQGTRRIAKTHLSRLRFPAPATVETWVSDAAGDPVLVVMAQPGASLAGELRALLPTLRTAVGDDRRVLVGFDRGGWSPALFAHMHEAGFDVLTWRKGPAQDVAADDFVDVTFVEENGREHTWTLADTTVDLPLGRKDEASGEEEVFTMRQITRIDDKKGVAKQLHILTTRTDLPAGQVVYRMGSRWRQENYFRYARMHFDLDSHDSYTSTADDPHRMVPNPAKKRAHQVVTAARARYERAVASTDAALLAARSPKPGQGHEVLISNTEHDQLTANLRAAEAELTAAQTAHKELPVRVRLGDLHPGQQVPDTETKLLHHCIRMAAFNTATTIARGIRVHTTYARANHEAHALARQILTATGDIDPTADGVLTIRLDPLPTARATAAAAQLCEHLSATNTTYPGTNLTLRYEIKTRS
ncbi:MAG: putative transposase [Microbacteriaceae bacterium]